MNFEEYLIESDIPIEDLRKEASKGGHDPGEHMVYNTRYHHKLASNAKKANNLIRFHHHMIQYHDSFENPNKEEMKHHILSYNSLQKKPSRRYTLVASDAK